MEGLLPSDPWERIFDHLSEDALFPAAMSCKYFRKRQLDLAKRGKRMRTALSGERIDARYYADTPFSPSYLRWIFFSRGGAW